MHVKFSWTWGWVVEQLGSGPISKVFQLSSPALAKHSDFPLTNPIQTQDAKPIRTSMGIFPDIERGILAMLERRTICLTISPWFRFRLSLMGLGLHESYHHRKDFHIEEFEEKYEEFEDKIWRNTSIHSVIPTFTMNESINK